MRDITQAVSELLTSYNILNQFNINYEYNDELALFGDDHDRFGTIHFDKLKYVIILSICNHRSLQIDLSEEGSTDALIAAIITNPEYLRRKPSTNIYNCYNVSTSSSSSSKTTWINPIW